ncbi:hypothetical protein B9Z55_024115 [Caenorhabditis nigoni]|uniref:Uncharacterized protein n=1 Tax=Caenorhabditis nigoni TaxID=1611254 RepID=A0A2G5ST26_9PELO|nr:hypothetical protein B9Z55_024115 [Caenorhabditis nigoni]
MSNFAIPILNLICFFQSYKFTEAWELSMTAMMSLVCSSVQQFENKQKDCDLCEVCFKPVSLDNIDVHLAAGCGKEIQKRYNLPRSKPRKRVKKVQAGEDKFKVPKKKTNTLPQSKKDIKKETTPTQNQ